MKITMLLRKFTMRQIMLYVICLSISSYS